MNNTSVSKKKLISELRRIVAWIFISVAVAVVLIGAYLLFFEQFTPTILTVEGQFESVDISERVFLDAVQDVLASDRERHFRVAGRIFVLRKVNRNPSITSKITDRALTLAEQADRDFDPSRYFTTPDWLPPSPDRLQPSTNALGSGRR